MGGDFMGTIDLDKTLLKFLKLPKEKQILVAGFVEGVQYKEIEKPKEPDSVPEKLAAQTAN